MLREATREENKDHRLRCPCRRLTAVSRRLQSRQVIHPEAQDADSARLYRLATGYLGMAAGLLVFRHRHSPHLRGNLTCII